MAVKSHIISLPLLSDLRNQMGNNDNVVITTGQTVVRDGKGRLYSWDSLSVEAEDSSFNIVKPTQLESNQAGRWKALFTRRLVLPNVGTTVTNRILFVNSGKIEYFCSTKTDNNSESKIYLTIDGLVGGVPIFSTVLFDDSKANVNASTVNDMVNSCRKSLVGNLLIHIFGRGNSSLLNLSIITTGITIGGLRAATVDTPVTFYIQGE